VTGPLDDQGRATQAGGGAGGRGLAGISSDARRFELKPLVVVAVLAGAVLAFALFAGAVMDGDTHGFDTWLLQILRESTDPADPIGPRWFEEMVRDITALGSTVVLTFAVAAVAGYLWIKDRPQKAFFLIASVALGALVQRALKFGFARPRPDVVAHGAYVSTESFPSGHSANSAIVYLLLGMMLARVETSYPAKVFIFSMCALITLAVGLSRIYLGVHWPTDVLAGWAVGSCWVLICWYVLLKWQPSGTRE
jgi:undecaprenyl-diphosphatase